MSFGPGTHVRYPAGYPRPRPGGGRTAALVFPLPFGGRRSLLGHPFPPGIPPLLRSAYRHQVPDHDGVSTFRTHEIRPEWAPSVPRDRRCSRGPGPFPGPPPAALPRRGSCHPGPAVTYPGLSLTRHQSRVHIIRPPGLPLTRGPRMTRGTLRLYPGLRTHADRTRARTPGQGQAQSTSLEQRHQHYVMLALQSARFTRNMYDLVSHSSSGTSWPPESPTTNSAPTTSPPASIPTAKPAASSPNSKPSATPSPSPQPPDPAHHRRPRHHITGQGKPYHELGADYF